eukprot:COSAG05_NODE_1833_length_3998_cov_5.510900_3_plen_129_part_00
MEKVGRLFGDGVCAEDMVAYAQQKKERKAQKKRAKAAKKAQNVRRQEEQRAMAEQNRIVRGETTECMKLCVLGIVDSAVKQGESIAARRGEEVALVVERIILDIEDTVKGERFDILVSPFPSLATPME